MDDDDFFASLEAELSQSLGDYGGDNKSETEEDDDSDDDFFASLQLEMGRALDEEQSESDDNDDDDDDVSLEDDFFSSLMNDLAGDVELEPPAKIESSKSVEVNDAHNIDDLSSLTVPELKDMLRDRGLKVGGKKAELIDRLQGTP